MKDHNKSWSKNQNKCIKEEIASGLDHHQKSKRKKKNVVFNKAGEALDQISINIFDL